MNLTCAATARWLRERDGYLILTHKRPDGDTIGCAVALCRTLRLIGKTAWILPNADATSLFAPYWGDTLAPEGFAPETVVSVDIASVGLFPENALPYRERVNLVIDHHPSNEGFGQEHCVEADKAACGEILYEIIRELLPEKAAPLPPDIALPLYVAVSTDTGCFVYSNTTPNTHAVAAALMESGIDFKTVNKRHFRTKSYVRLRLEGRMIETLDLHHDGQTAIAAISLEDMAQLHAIEEDVEDIAAVVGQLQGVLTSVTIRELKPGECKLSVRTAIGGPNASKICAQLGGGGHAAAAGCTVKGSVEEAKKAIFDAINTVKAEG